MKKKEEEQKMESREDRALSRLLQLAGRRPDVPQETRDRVKSGVRAQWKRSMRVRFWKRGLFFAFGSAAMAMTVIVFAFWLAAQDLPRSVSAGFVENQTGSVEVISPDGNYQRLSRNEPVLTGSRLESGASGRVMLRLLNRASIRVDVNTRLQLLSESAFLLERGTVYIDSEGTGAKLTLQTPHGIVRNMGTQFEVNVDPEAIRIRVREGAILLQQGGTRESADAGTELSMSRVGPPTRAQVASYSPYYNWLSEIPSVYHMEGSSLQQFLSWVSRENGWTVQYSDTSIGQGASRIILHGSVQTLRPQEMLRVVLPVCGLTYHLQDGVLKLDRTHN